MKIFKSKYGWSTSAHSNTKDGEKIRCFLDCQFKKGEEPLGEDIEGTLVFKGIDGTERDCFFSSYLKQGEPVVKLVLMRHGQDKQTILSDGTKDVLGHNVEIDPDSLPFY